MDDLVQPPQQDTLYQTSAIAALLEGVCRGDTTIGELKHHGNFGLGTFDDLDGEMVILDGQVYQFRPDGGNTAVDSQTTPFAAITFWEPDITVQLKEFLDYAQLQAYLDGLLPSKNIFYAIKIEGSFEAIKTRTVGKQTQKTRLVEASATQAVTEFHQIQGTLVGFWTPAYMQSLNVPGYHLHFISQDHCRGGHLLDCRTTEVTISLDCTPNLEMRLPQTSDFMNAVLDQDRSQELYQAEH